MNRRSRKCWNTAGPSARPTARHELPKSAAPARRALPALEREKEAAMIELTAQQRQELTRANGNAVRITDPDSGQEYVILRAEVYEYWKQLLYDDGDWTPQEQLRLLAESGKRAGWDDPEMDVYDNYDENRKK